MRVAVLTMRLFDEPRSGGELCTARLLRGLEQAGHDIVVFGRGQGPARQGRQTRFVSVGAPVPAFDDMPLPQRLATPLSALATGRPVTTQRLHGMEASRAVQLQLARIEPQLDVLVVDHLQALTWIEPMLHALPAPMIVMHNLEADGYEERALNIAGNRQSDRLRRWLLQREARLLRRLEFKALRHGSVIACLSEPDALRFRELGALCGAQLGVEVLPGYSMAQRHGADGADGAAITGPPNADGAAMSRASMAALHGIPRGARLIGMIGTWTWEPNRAGLQWMLEHVHPHLPEDCWLVVAGSGLEGLRVPVRTVVLGRIAEVRTLYDAVDVVAIPSVRGSGVHEKAIEAIGSGLTVVATPHALRGLLPHLPRNVHVADGAEAFAQRCAKAPSRSWWSAVKPWDAWAARRSHEYRQALQRCLEAAAVRACAPSA